MPVKYTKKPREYIKYFKFIDFIDLTERYSDTIVEEPQKERIKIVILDYKYLFEYLCTVNKSFALRLFFINVVHTVKLSTAWRWVTTNEWK